MPNEDIPFYPNRRDDDYRPQSSEPKFPANDPEQRPAPLQTGYRSEPRQAPACKKSIWESLMLTKLVKWYLRRANSSKLVDLQAKGCRVAVLGDNLDVCCLPGGAIKHHWLLGNNDLLRTITINELTAHQDYIESIIMRTGWDNKIVDDGSGIHVS